MIYEEEYKPLKGLKDWAFSYYNSPKYSGDKKQKEKAIALLSSVFHTKFVSSETIMKCKLEELEYVLYSFPTALSVKLADLYNRELSEYQKKYCADYEVKKDKVLEAFKELRKEFLDYDYDFYVMEQEDEVISLGEQEELLNNMVNASNPRTSIQMDYIEFDDEKRKKYDLVFEPSPMVKELLDRVDDRELLRDIIILDRKIQRNEKICELIDKIARDSDKESFRKTILSLSDIYRRIKKDNMHLKRELVEKIAKFNKEHVINTEPKEEKSEVVSRVSNNEELYDLDDEILEELDLDDIRIK